MSTLAAMLHKHAVRERLGSAGRTGACGDRKLKPKGPSVMIERGNPAGLDDPGQQQRVGPHREAGDDAGDGAARRGVAPDQPAEECRRELGDGRKGDEADGGQAVRLAQQTIEQIAQQDDGEDGDAADGQQQPGSCPSAGPWARRRRRRNDKRQHQAVADHDRQRHRIDDHHGGGGRQAADECQQRYGFGARRQRQAEHEGCPASKRALGQGYEARRRRWAPRTG